MFENDREIGVLVGLTLTKIEGAKGNDEIVFHVDDGRKFRMYHYQGCCENVTVEDICGDWADLIGSPILRATEDTSEENPADASADVLEYQDSFTWTFYNIATIKGHVTIRWYGESNGYYSESVDFEEIPNIH